MPDDSLSEGHDRLAGEATGGGQQSPATTPAPVNAGNAQHRDASGDKPTSFGQRHAEHAAEPVIGTEAGSRRDVDVEGSAEQFRAHRRIRQLEDDLRDLRAGVALDANALEEAGVYRYHHPLEHAAHYQERLADVSAKITAAVRDGRAVMADESFTFNGSPAKGRKLVHDLSTLMLRAYNAEAENCVRSMRSGNLALAIRRLSTAVTQIEKLGAIIDLRINPDYHALRVEELELTGDYQMKVREERERAREEREQLRDQRRAEQELAAEREKLEKERAHYESALVALQERGDVAAAAELQQRLTDIGAAIERNDYRIANIRAGYVYVISNLGAFGPGVVKIGMTRRLEPRDRIRELGDASVPFLYDVHALFFSDDAIALESALHAKFADRRLNRVNERREFFFATPDEVREELRTQVDGGGLLEFVAEAEAPEYHQSRSGWPKLA
ncbi:DUF4041 domain-containing protein [Actinosynnema sp.]|uniref:DUF4041 domain-containing protein n=1 Tax=Actinosynnema sp. TaxID=1872144 RepID=UPI003F825C4D